MTAVGDALFLDDARSLGDIDTAAVTFDPRFRGHLSNQRSRRAVIGHDQRIEAFGESGMLISQNRTDHTLERFTAEFSGAGPRSSRPHATATGRRIGMISPTSSRWSGTGALQS